MKKELHRRLERLFIKYHEDFEPPDDAAKRRGTPLEFYDQYLTDFITDIYKIAGIAGNAREDMLKIGRSRIASKVVRERVKRNSAE